MAIYEDMLKENRDIEMKRTTYTIQYNGVTVGQKNAWNTALRLAGELAVQISGAKSVTRLRVDSVEKHLGNTVCGDAVFQPESGEPLTLHISKE